MPIQSEKLGNKKEIIKNGITTQKIIYRATLLIMHLELTGCSIVTNFSAGAGWFFIFYFLGARWCSALVILQSTSQIDSITWHVCHENCLSCVENPKDHYTNENEMHKYCTSQNIWMWENLQSAMQHCPLARIQHWCIWAPIMSSGSGGGVSFSKTSIKRINAYQLSNRLAGAASFSNTDIIYRSRAG